MSAIIGAILIALPFIAVTVLMVRTVGAKETAVIWLATAVTVSVLAAGLYLIGAR